MDPPGEWTKVWLYTAAGVGISGVLFWFIHSMARPQPRTMTKEWQEATNEYLKVSRYPRPVNQLHLGYFPPESQTNTPLIVTTNQPHVRYQQRGILRPGYGSEQVGQSTGH